MIEYLLFDNHGVDLPYKAGSTEGLYIPDGDLEAIHEASKRGLFHQVRQAVLAEELGYHYYFHSEHHFNTEGTEHNSANFVVQAAVAALTTKIRLGQLANILPWWDPIRLAEHAAALDVLSHGRLEFGIGRGYQVREGETFGALLGSSVQDQEKNRLYFDEAYEVIRRAWSLPSMSFHGEFFNIPPAWALWGHKQTAEYFNDPVSGYDYDKVVNPGVAGPPGAGPAQTNTTTTLREISVFPQPLQSPYPQVWTPVTSDRSVQWAASRGANAFLASESDDSARSRVQKYMEFSEAEGWPDRQDRGEFARGWDSSKKRGIVVGRGVFATDNGVGTMEQIRNAISAEMSFFGSFGFDYILKDDDGNLVPPDQYYDKWIEIGLGFVGSNDRIIEGYLNLHKLCGYGDDFVAAVQIARPGLGPTQIQDQVQNFAENIMPVLNAELGGPKPIEEVSPVLRRDEAKI